MITDHRNFDLNDWIYVVQRWGNPVAGLAAPISKYKKGAHKGKNKINPHVTDFLMKNGRIVSVYHVKPIYYLHTNGEWRPLSEVTTHHGNRKLILNNKWEQIEPWYLRWLMKRCELISGQVLIPWRFDNVPVREGREIYFTTTTVYPDPDPETTTVDGVVRHAYATGSGVTWATLRADAGTTSTDNATTWRCHSQGSDNVTDKWKYIDRGICLFDTSSIPDGDTKDSATLSLYGSSKDDGLVITPNLNIFTSVPASNTALAAGDYDSLGTVAQSDTSITYASFSTTAYNDFAFNATGLGNISLTAVSKFGTRNKNYDSDNVAPTWASLNESFVTCIGAETAGTSTDPKLAVVHTTPATGALQGFNMTGFWGA